MHGVSPQQFAESVSAFLGPFYIALAAMNGIAAYLMWQKFKPVTYFRIPMPGFSIPVTNALIWTIVALVYMVLAAMSVGATQTAAMLPQMPQAFLKANCPRWKKLEKLPAKSIFRRSEKFSD